MRVSIFIDSNGWNFLFERGINLVNELPPGEFSIAMTREVEIELEAIRDKGKDGSSKLELKRYIREAKESHPVVTTAVFGFQTFETDGTPSKVQVYAGFGQGTFQSEEDRSWYSREDIKKQLYGKSRTNSGLGRNEADASLAARSFQSVVLTNEKRTKPGPLKIAAELGGRIVYLSEFDGSGLSLRDYVLSR